MKIGEIMAQDREITLNGGKKTVVLTVANTGDRPVQVGSHYHFFEVNRCLSFDREKAYGYHLDIPSGTSVRFEPGEEKSVQLTELGGTKRVFGLNDLTCAQATDVTKEAAMEKAAEKGFIRKQEA
jgi:urease beta subunit